MMSRLWRAVAALSSTCGPYRIGCSSFLIVRNFLDVSTESRRVNAKPTLPEGKKEREKQKLYPGRENRHVEGGPLLVMAPGVVVTVLGVYILWGRWHTPYYTAEPCLSIGVIGVIVSS